MYITMSWGLDSIVYFESIYIHIFAYVCMDMDSKQTIIESKLNKQVHEYL
jgi:hypothetical protein